MNWITLRDRSYTAAKKLKIGGKVRLTENARYASPRAAKHVGRTGTLRSIDNAGFNGMIAHVVLDTPDDAGAYISVPASALRMVK